MRPDQAAPLSRGHGRDQHAPACDADDSERGPPKPPASTGSRQHPATVYLKEVASSTFQVTAADIHRAHQLADEFHSEEEGDDNQS